MARTPAQRKALESKALANDVKSEGMRMLLQADYTVAEVKSIFKAPYGFVYGVAKRAGLAETAATRRAPRKVQAARPAKAAAKVTKATRTQAREQKAAPAARSAKGRAQAKPSRTAQTVAQTGTRGRGRPPVTDPKAIAARSPEAQRSAARRAAAGSATVVVYTASQTKGPSSVKATRTIPAATVRKVASATNGSAVSRVAAKLNARKG